MATSLKLDVTERLNVYFRTYEESGEDRVRLIREKYSSPKDWLLIGPEKREEYERLEVIK